MPEQTTALLKVLKLSPLNVRQDPGDITELVASIRSVGIISPLAVNRNWEVIAGGRRLAALQVIHGPESHEHIPVVLFDDDQIEVSLAENFCRQSMTPVQEFLAFKMLADEGLTEEQIADKFGVETTLVRQRMKLAALSKSVIKAMQNELITFSQATALTLHTKGKQEEIVKNIATHKAQYPDYNLPWYLSADGIREAFTKQLVSIDKAIFDLVKADLKTTTDLFTGKTFFADTGKFWEAQNDAVNKLQADLKKEGWSWVMVYHDYPPLHTFGRTEDKTMGGVAIHLRKDGTVEIHKDLLRKSDLKKDKAKDGKKKVSKAERELDSTKVAQEYMSDVVRLAMIHHMTDQEAEALFIVSMDYGPYLSPLQINKKIEDNILVTRRCTNSTVRFDITPQQARNTDETFTAAWMSVAESIRIDDVTSDNDGESFDGRWIALIPHFWTRALYLSDIEREMFNVMASQSSRTVNEMIREVWTPDETFFLMFKKDQLGDWMQELSLKKSGSKATEMALALAEYFNAEDQTKEQALATQNWIPMQLFNFIKGVKPQLNEDREAA